MARFPRIKIPKWVPPPKVALCFDPTTITAPAGYKTVANPCEFELPAIMEMTAEPPLHMPRHVQIAIAYVRQWPEAALVGENMWAVWMPCRGMVAVSMPRKRHTGSVEVLAVVLPFVNPIPSHGVIGLPRAIQAVMVPAPDDVYIRPAWIPTRFPWEPPPIRPTSLSALRDAHEAGED